ncbi:MAG: ATP-binding cassette domain-containing protein [Lachnospiraceae bacterium]|nr:ATP-binding cassette domain-containing protein [Lachnospiraceae bacterium]
MKIENITKKYGKKTVLDNISFCFENGIYGILGPNGAGKTTLMKCIIGLEKYDGKIEGIKKEDIGYLPQKFSMFRQLTVKEAMIYICMMKGADENSIDDILKKVNLLEEKEKKIKKLSGGMLRRLGIAQAVVGNPKILIVDEPTVGLDPKERIRFRNLLAQISNDRIVLISSHIVEDIESIANNIIIMSEGKFKTSGSLGEVLSLLKGKVGQLQVDKNEVSKYSEKIVTDVNYQGSKAVIHLVGDELPKCELIEPSLEDAYFYLCKE